jgi:KDO2-lipid IV(A) lauroyltransferase
MTRLQPVGRQLRRAAGDRLEQGLVWWLRAVVACLAQLPLGWVLAGGRAAADLSFPLGRRRRVVFANLDAVFAGGMSAAEKRRVARSANRNVFLTLLEMLRSSHVAAGDEMAHCLEFRPQALAESVDVDARGAVIAMAHSGNFDQIGVAWSRRFSKPAWAVMKPLKMARVSRFLEEGRRRFGFGVINARGVSSMLRSVRRVNRGEIVCILPDQYARSHGSVVDFLGVPASTHRGAASVALQSRNPRIVVAVDTRVDDGARHECHLIEIDDFVRSDDFEGDVDRLTQRFCDVMGEVVAEHPESYLWHHRRWGHPGSAVRRLGKGGAVRT